MKKSKAQDIYNYLVNKKAKFVADNKAKYGEKFIFIFKYGYILTVFGQDADLVGNLGATVNIYGRASFRSYDESNYLRKILNAGRKAAIVERIG